MMEMPVDESNDNAGKKPIAEFYKAPSCDPYMWLRAVLTRVLPMVFAASFIAVYIIWYVPLILMAIVCVITLGCLYGLFVRNALERVNCRRKYVVIVSLILAVAFGWWSNWVVWTDLYLNQTRQIRMDIPLIPVYNINLSITDPIQLAYLMVSPGKMMDFLVATYDNGLYSIFSRSTEGTGSAIAWLLELGGFVIGAFSVIWEVYEVPYSQRKGIYYDKSEFILQYIEDPESLKRSVETGDFEVLRSFLKSRNGASHAHLTLYHLDGETSYVTIVNKYSSGKGLFESTNDTTLVRHLAIDRETSDILRKISVESGTG